MLRSITAGDCDNYKMYLIGLGLAPMTVRKRLQFAKTVFRAMVKHMLISSNPFADVRGHATMDSARQHFISREDTAKLIAACPNWEWRTIVAFRVTAVCGARAKSLACDWTTSTGPAAKCG